MSKPRLQLQAVIDTEAHADTIIASIRAELVGKDVFEEHSLSKYVDALNDNKVTLVFDFRFNNRIHRDDVKTWLKNQVRDHPVVKTWVESVKLTQHTCTHDDVEVKPCTETEYVVEFER